MRPAKHGLSKWLYMRSTEFHDGANIVGKQVARNLDQTVAGINAVGIAAVSFKFCDDSDVLAKIERSRTPTTIQRESRDDVVVLRVRMDVGIITRNLNLVVLRE